MVELIFAIVIIGILSGIAIPRLAATRDDADIAKGRSEVSSIRSAIALKRNTLLTEGNFSEFDLDTVAPNTPNQELFNNVLNYGIPAGTTSGKWRKDDNKTYIFILNRGEVAFNYDKNNYKFNCANPASANCLLLTQ